MGRSYKNVTIESTVSAITDAISTLQSLGEECREIVDNASENLRQTSRIQTFDETASALENISEPDIPECVAELAITYTSQQSARKGRSESRATRCANEVAVLSAARDAAQTWIEERTEELEADDKTAEEDDAVQEAVQFVSELDDLISEVEGCEFPGMYG